MWTIDVWNMVAPHVFWKAQKGAERPVFLIHKKPTFYWTPDAGMEKNIMELNSKPPMPSMPILW